MNHLICSIVQPGWDVMMSPRGRRSDASEPYLSNTFQLVCCHSANSDYPRHVRACTQTHAHTNTHTHVHAMTMALYSPASCLACQHVLSPLKPSGITHQYISAEETLHNTSHETICNSMQMVEKNTQKNGRYERQSLCGLYTIIRGRMLIQKRIEVRRERCISQNSTVAGRTLLLLKLILIKLKN